MKSSKNDIFFDIETWQTNRRRFVKTLVVSGVITQIPFFHSCENKEKIIFQANDYLDAKQVEILHDVLLILFPDDGNGPSAIDINALIYVIWNLSDEYKSESAKEYIINGINWTDETAFEENEKYFIDLNQKEKEEIVGFISNEKWGKDWLSVILTLILEALALDPIYNVNTDEVGWKWLEHSKGFPQPTQELAYPQIYTSLGKE